MKKLLSFVLIVAMVLTMAACGNNDGQEAQTYTWKAANVLNAGGPWDIGLQEFKRLLSEKSNGAIELEIFNGGQLGQERDTIEGLGLGTTDFVICSSATLSNFTDTQNIWDLPYLFHTAEEARGVLDSEIGQSILDTLSDVGIKGLAYWENGMYMLGSTKPIETPEDMKGLRIRTIESNLQADLYGAFGATSVVIPWGDIYTSLQQGLCDVTTTTLANMYSAKQNEVATYITEANQIYGPAPLLMSQSLWDSLPEDIQGIVLEAAKEACLVERDAVDAAHDSAKATMESEGCTFYEVDTEEWAAYVEPLYDKYVGTMGITKENFDAVRAEAEKFR